MLAPRVCIYTATHPLDSQYMPLSTNKSPIPKIKPSIKSGNKLNLIENIQIPFKSNPQQI